MSTPTDSTPEPSAEGDNGGHSSPMSGSAPSDALSEHVAKALARAYAHGWQQHGALVGEIPATLSPEQWASANWQAFSGDAVDALLPNPKLTGTEGPV